MVGTAPRRRRRNGNIDRSALPLSPYGRVSTREQAESRAGLDHQVAVVQGHAGLHGIELLPWEMDPGRSAKDLNRPGLQNVLAAIAAGTSGGIIVAKIDRLSRSVIDFQNLMLRAKQEGWNLICLDIGVDLRSPGGQMVAGIIATIAQWERDVIGERTRDALAEKARAGVRIGRPREISDEMMAAVFEAFYGAEGNYSEAARRLNRDRLGTPRGGSMWYPAGVRGVVLSQDAAGLRERFDLDWMVA